MKTLYTVVTDLDSDDLEQLVTEYLDNGWSLHGGVALTTWVERWTDHDGQQSETYTRYAQALVREVPE